MLASKTYHGIGPVIFFRIMLLSPCHTMLLPNPMLLQLDVYMWVSASLRVYYCSGHG